MYIFAAKLPHFVELTKEKADYLLIRTFFHITISLTYLTE